MERSLVYELAGAADRREIIDFINMVFSVSHRPHDFKKILPKVYGDGAAWYNRTAHFIERNDGRITAVVAALPLELRVLDKRLKVGYVGSVSAHPYERGRGAMKALMVMAREYAESSGMCALMLGGQRQRYEYFGYRNAGLKRVYSVNKANVRHGLADISVEDVILRKVTEGDAELLDKIYELHGRQKVAVERPREALHFIMISWEYEILACEIGGAFTGYALVNNKDNHCSELVVADAASVRPFIKAIVKERGELGVTLRSYQAHEKAIVGEFAEAWRIEQEMQVCLLNGALTEAYAALHNGNGDIFDGEYPAALDFPQADDF